MSQKIITMAIVLAALGGVWAGMTLYYASSSAAASSIIPTPQIALSDKQVAALAGNDYKNGKLPVGDGKYVTNAPKQGYVYLCNVHKDNPGSMVTGTWMHGTTWNPAEKVSVDGGVSWPKAVFKNIISGANRLLTGNGLPINHKTGVFPVAKNDDAAKFDPNPNTISAQKLSDTLPVNPTYSATPYCMGGEVGVMLSGVPLFNGFDAGLRDAQAHEVQDSCDGHPQGSGEYHYHGLSSCFKDTSVKTILGYAYDGFPITGPQVTKTSYLTTSDLDVCHGITSAITVNGKDTVTYHYVMTKDFPYSVSCFRGKPITTGPSSGAPTAGSRTQQSPGGQPPAEALTACTGKKSHDTCVINTPQGDSLAGTCDGPQGSPILACRPI